MTHCMNKIKCVCVLHAVNSVCILQLHTQHALTHIYTHTYTNIHTLSLSLSVYHTHRSHTHTHTHIHTHTNTHTNTDKNTKRHTSSPTHVLITNMHTHTRTRTHTHIRSLSLLLSPLALSQTQIHIRTDKHTPNTHLLCHVRSPTSFLRYTATHCNSLDKLQDKATHCIVLHTPGSPRQSITLLSATHCNTLQHTAMHYHTMQRYAHTCHATSDHHPPCCNTL